jgi:release factor glutamine methyltransferase
MTRVPLDGLWPTTRPNRGSVEGRSQCPHVETQRFARRASGYEACVRVLTLPGVFRPISDSRLLADRMRQELAPGATVADVCTGSGVLAVAAALAGAGAVTAVDISRRAVLTTFLNARLNGVAVRALQGDLLSPLAGERFDLIVSNPPYLPAETDATPTSGPTRAWDAGHDGRALLDRLCDQAADHLKPGGALLIVHSSVCGEATTREQLERGGLHVEVVVRHRGPLGPRLSDRVAYLERQGLLGPGTHDEELLVIRGRRPADKA